MLSTLSNIVFKEQIDMLLVIQTSAGTVLIAAIMIAAIKGIAAIMTAAMEIAPVTGTAAIVVLNLVIQTYVVKLIAQKPVVNLLPVQTVVIVILSVLAIQSVHVTESVLVTGYNKKQKN